MKRYFEQRRIFASFEGKIGNGLNNEMNEEENKIKGGVIIIGSLFWEDKDNAIQEKESKDLAEKRKEWREAYLDLADKREKKHKLPIRYGRCSSSRKCTYTMVFSSLALNTQRSV